MRPQGRPQKWFTANHRSMWPVPPFEEALLHLTLEVLSFQGGQCGGKLSAWVRPTITISWLWESLCTSQCLLPHWKMEMMLPLPIPEKTQPCAGRLLSSLLPLEAQECMYFSLTAHSTGRCGRQMENVCFLHRAFLV